MTLIGEDRCYSTFSAAGIPSFGRGQRHEMRGALERRRTPRTLLIPLPLFTDAHVDELFNWAQQGGDPSGWETYLPAICLRDALEDRFPPFVDPTRHAVLIVLCQLPRARFQKSIGGPPPNSDFRGFVQWTVRYFDGLASVRIGGGVLPGRPRLMTCSLYEGHEDTVIRAIGTALKMANALNMYVNDDVDVHKANEKKCCIC